MIISSSLDQHRREFARAVANHKYEITPAGVYFRDANAWMAGMIGTTLNGKDLQITPNTFTIEGLNYLMNCGFKAASPETAFYVAAFSGNVTPASSLTAAAFPGTMTEATAYAEATRPLFVSGTVAAGAVSNSASRAEITSTGTINIWGAGLVSVATKSAVTGVLAAAAKFGAVRALVPTDVLAFQWTLTLTPV